MSDTVTVNYTGQAGQLDEHVSGRLVVEAWQCVSSKDVLLWKQAVIETLQSWLFAMTTKVNVRQL